MTSTRSRMFPALTLSAALVGVTACSGGGDPEEVPVFGDIEDTMWESMSEAESVTISADISAETQEDAFGSAMVEQMLGADVSEIAVYGSLDGSGSAMRFGEEDFVRVFDGDTAYMSADRVVAMMTGWVGGDLGEEDQQAMEEFSDELEGQWLDYSDELSGDDLDDFEVSGLLESMRESWEEEDGDESPIQRSEISDEGVHEERDGEDVWVYSGSEEGAELVIAADHDRPYILEVTDGSSAVELSGWDDTDAPERPDDSDLISEAELEDRFAQLEQRLNW